MAEHAIPAIAKGILLDPSRGDGFQIDGQVIPWAVSHEIDVVDLSEGNGLLYGVTVTFFADSVLLLGAHEARRLGAAEADAAIASTLARYEPEADETPIFTALAARELPSPPNDPAHRAGSERAS